MMSLVFYYGCLGEFISQAPALFAAKDEDKLTGCNDGYE